MSFQLHRDNQFVPCDLATLREMARKGELPQDEYVFDERVREWVGAAQIAEMKDAWSIGENEATVAMELTPEMLALFEQADARQPEPVAEVEAPRAAPAPAVLERAEPVRPEPVRPAPVAAAAPAPSVRAPEVEPLREVTPARSATPRLTAAAAPSAQGGAGLPKWVLPAAIGAAVVLVAVILWVALQK